MVLPQHERIGGAEPFRERDEAAALRARLHFDATDAGDQHIPGEETTGSPRQRHPLRREAEGTMTGDHFALDAVALSLAASSAHERPRTHQ